MKKFLLSALIILSSGAIFADGHSSAEKTVLANLDAYWDARNSEDWDKVVAMSSCS